MVFALPEKYLNRPSTNITGKDLLCRYGKSFVTDSAVELMEKNRNEINKSYVELQHDKLDIAEILLNSGKSILKLFLALFLSAIGLYFILKANIIVKIIAI